MKTVISPSILSSDFSALGAEAKRMEACGADWLHIDVMDGHFVPNITLGAPIVASLRKHSNLFFDVHLMISDPYKYVPDFAKAGADIITFHIESDSDPLKTVELIHSLGCQAGIAIKPNTSVEAVLPLLDKIEMVLVMTVEPGFGGQSFMADMMPKLEKLKSVIERESLNLRLQVDGGIGEKTISVASQAGADTFVAGSAVFGASDPEKMIALLRTKAE